jgi:hypothetical protein
MKRILEIAKNETQSANKKPHAKNPQTNNITTINQINPSKFQDLSE